MFTTNLWLPSSKPKIGTIQYIHTYVTKKMRLHRHAPAASKGVHCNVWIQDKNENLGTRIIKKCTNKCDKHHKHHVLTRFING